METALAMISANKSKVDGMAISLTDKDTESLMRCRLPAGVQMYSGDDFNDPELIKGEAQGYCHALLGILTRWPRRRPLPCNGWGRATPPPSAPCWTRLCRWPA